MFVMLLNNGRKGVKEDVSFRVLTSEYTRPYGLGKKIDRFVKNDKNLRGNHRRLLVLCLRREGKEMVGIAPENAIPEVFWHCQISKIVYI